MEPVPLKYGKLATKYPWVYGYFYSVELSKYFECRGIFLHSRASYCRLYCCDNVSERQLYILRMFSLFLSFIRSIFSTPVKSTAVLETSLLHIVTLHSFVCLQPRLSCNWFSLLFNNNIKLLKWYDWQKNTDLFYAQLQHDMRRRSALRFAKGYNESNYN